MIADIALVVTAAVAGLLAHEATHYAVCRAIGAPARPRLRWATIQPMVAIETTYRAHTATTVRITSLAPLAVFLPSFAAVGVAASVGVSVGFTTSMAAIMWLSATFPSNVDLRLAWDAAAVDTYHAVWNGDHPTHAAAEGY